MTKSSNDAAKTIELFEKATAENRDTASRHGNLIELSREDAADVMVTADLHGQRLTFQRLIDDADLQANQTRHLVMQEVCHGGPVYPSTSYPSTSSCMSHLLLEDVARLKVEFPERFHFLLSNHELAEVTDFPITKKGRILNLTFRAGIAQMYGEAADDVQQAYGEFLISCPLAVRLENGVFVSHSIPASVDQREFDESIFHRDLTSHDLSPKGDVFRLVWGRDFREENVATFAEQVGANILLTGHEPCKAGFSTPNSRQIILDCCGDRACYLIVPVGESVSQADLVERITKVY